MTVSHVACLHGIQPSLLFKWKNNIWKEVSLLLLPERMSFLPLLHEKPSRLQREHKGRISEKESDQCCDLAVS
ncbi:hypothetical protein OM195_21060 [Escherichia albertii]|nr:hypothetical protein [Escherichia albertii]MCZ8812502.1 hypothetical protein [Escherichia albertii]